MAYTCDVMPKRSSKPDMNLLAKFIVNQATGEVTVEDIVAKAIEEGKNPAAVLLGRQGGLKGGNARAVKLSAEKRREIAKNAANARWHKGKGDGKNRSR